MCGYFTRQLAILGVLLLAQRDAIARILDALGPSFRETPRRPQRVGPGRR